MTVFQRHIRKSPGSLIAAAILIAACHTSARAEFDRKQTAAEKTTAVIHCNYSPVTFWDARTDQPSGFAVEIINGAARRAGLQVGYICKPGWPEMMTSVETGEADISVLLKSEERKKTLLFSSPIAITYLSYFARSQSALDPGAVPLGENVGVIKGSRSYEHLKNRPGVHLSLEGTYQEGIFSLLAGKTDLFAGEESLIQKQAREAGLEDRIKKIGMPFSEQERCLAVRKGNDQLLARLNSALQGFIGSPEYQQIYLKWYGAPASYWTTDRILVAGGAFLFVVICGMAYWRYKSLFSINKELVRTIDERKRTEVNLWESESKFRSVFEQATDGIMIADGETKRHVEANKAMCALLGYTRDELLGLRIDAIHPKKALPAIRELFEKQLRGEISLAPEVPMLKKDGSVFYADINSSRITLGEKECLVGIFRDITERKQAETVLKMREKQLAESQRIAHIGSWEHNPVTGGVFWSDELFRLLGLDPKKDPGDFNLFFAMIHPDDRPALKQAIDQTLKQQIPFSIDYRFILRDGRLRIIHAQAELIPDESGNLVVLSGTAQDITEQKRAEEKIQQSEQFIRNILDTVDEGFIVIDRDYRILTANKAYCNQASLPCNEVIGRHCYAISHKAGRPCYEEGEECAVREVFATGEPHAVLHKHEDHCGHRLFVETKGFPIKDASGNVTSVIETINNITEKHLLEEERLKTQKLEAIGTLAGGIAHDFNNLLQGVFGYISLARLRVDDREKSIAALGEAEKALHLSVRLTNQLLTFSKGGQPIKRWIGLRTVIENAAKFALCGSRSVCSIAAEEALWVVEADEGQLSQVIQNIVLNADQAMPGGGRVEITAKNVHASDTLPAPGLQKRDYVAVIVKDSGIGIPDHFVGKIFDPYFTTKEKGSGLGLATSYSIVKNHGGIIAVSSLKEQGTTFSIYIPALAEQKEVSVFESAKAAAGSAGRVLLMDDEEVVREVAGELIKELGHAVEFAIHGGEAIDKYRTALQSGRPFDLVVLDLTVRGGMGGLETVQQLLKINPQVKAVVSSGYSDDAAAANYEKEGFKAFLQKPYDVDALGEVLNKVLAG